MRTLSILFVCFFTACVSPAQEVSRLTTDLLEHTDRVYLDGYVSDLSLDQLGSAVERYQVAAIRSACPDLGWVVNSDKANTLQTAYRILVASSPELLMEGKADLWDSRRVESESSVAVPYNGTSLKPSTVYYWKVKVWDSHGRESDYSPVKSFMTADTLDETTAQYPLQVTDEYPEYIHKVEEKTTFVDFGKAAFGRLRLTLTSLKENETLSIHLGESAENGRINRKPGGTIRYTSYSIPLMQGTHTYTLKIRPDKRNTDGSANESGVKPILMPDYIGEVYPFRYCEIENYAGELKTTDLVRQMVHYPFNEQASFFHSSDTVLNRVWDLCKYSIKATSFAGIYVDGDRERIPYEADALINQLCHYGVDREFSIARYSHEYLIDYATWPAEWIMQSVIMAWNDYLYTGNKKSLERFYDDLKAKTLMGLKEENGLISTRTDKQTPALLQAIHFRGKALRDIVDWPQSGILGLGKSEPGEADGYVFTTYNTVVNAYHYHALQLMSRIAEVIGNEADQNYYSCEADKVKTQINSLLLNKKTGYYKDGIDTDHSALHANMFPMAFGIVPPKNLPQVKAFIRSRGLACSVYGSQFLLDAVYDAHDAEHGLSLLSSTAERSWYNMLRMGSTISTEAWDNKYKPNQDWNHAWGAAPANLIPRKLMGIEPLEPGFRKIRIKPQPATLRQAAIQVPTIRGDIKVSFENKLGECFEMEVEIPANSTAEVWLPRSSDKYKLLVNQIPQKGEVIDGFVKVLIGSGKHLFFLEFPQQ